MPVRVGKSQRPNSTTEARIPLRRSSKTQTNNNPKNSAASNAISPGVIQDIQRKYGNQAAVEMIRRAKLDPCEPDVPDINARADKQGLQRGIDKKALKKAMDQNPAFADVYPEVLDIIASANGELWRMIQNESMNVDLEFTADTSKWDTTEGQTWVWVEGRGGKRHRIENLDLGTSTVEPDHRIIIQIEVSPFFLNSKTNIAKTALTITHEYVLHAERYLRTIDIVRNSALSQEERQQLSSLFEREGDYDPDVHHRASHDEKSPDHERYLEMVTAVAEKLGERDPELKQKLLDAYKAEIDNYTTEAKIKKWIPQKIQSLLDM